MQLLVWLSCKMTCSLNCFGLVRSFVRFLLRPLFCTAVLFQLPQILILPLYSPGLLLPVMSNYFSPAIFHELIVSRWVITLADIHVLQFDERSQAGQMTDP